MITENHGKECLNRAIIHALAGAAKQMHEFGAIVTEPCLDYGLDGTFHHTEKNKNRMRQTGFKLDFQLKASKNWKKRDGCIHYNLEKKNYNDIVLQNSKTKIGASFKVLILYCMPPRFEDALVVSPEDVKISHGCYYSILNGAPLDTDTGTVPIRIPETQLLTPDALSDLLDKIADGRML